MEKYSFVQRLGQGTGFPSILLNQSSALQVPLQWYGKQGGSQQQPQLSRKPRHRLRFLQGRPAGSCEATETVARVGHPGAASCHKDRRQPSAARSWEACKQLPEAPSATLHRLHCATATRASWRREEVRAAASISDRRPPDSCWTLCWRCTRILNPGYNFAKALIRHLVQLLEAVRHGAGPRDSGILSMQHQQRLPSFALEVASCSSCLNTSRAACTTA